MLVAAVSLGAPRTALAQAEPDQAAADTIVDGTKSARKLAEQIVAPPPVAPSLRPVLQYGVAITNVFVASAGNICGSAPSAPCIFGSGGGLAVRAGVRTRGIYYLGGAYEMSKLDPSQLYRLAVWQQLRGEGRYYLPTGLITEPYLLGAVGASAYGNEWAIDTFGPTLSIGGGGEFEVSPTTTLGLAITYRAVYFTKFTDSAHTSRDPGVAHVIALDFSLEGRDPL
jgi:hypothetical protein